MTPGYNTSSKNPVERLINLKNARKSFRILLGIIPKLDEEEGKGKKPRSRFKIGEAVKIQFESEKDCYLTLVDIGTSGRVHVIIPSAFNVDNFVKGGRELLYPEGSWDVAAMIQGPTGTERIKAIVTLDPINLFDIDLRDARAISYTIAESELDSRITKLQKKLDSLESTSWSEALCEFKIV
ncbi:MAG: DUF4384 domain-containing protein [Candidatus Eremiobacteraeota bacterium]|nr:DUF4384 domain-containing protein [Candidatus Eremiobacteraeota bacterium]